MSGIQSNSRDSHGNWLRASTVLLILRRKLAWCGVVAAISAAVGLWLGALLPPQYEARAVLAISENVLGSAVWDRDPQRGLAAPDLAREASAFLAPEEVAAALLAGAPDGAHVALVEAPTWFQPGLFRWRPARVAAQAPVRVEVLAAPRSDARLRLELAFGADSAAPQVSGAASATVRGDAARWFVEVGGWQLAVTATAAAREGRFVVRCLPADAAALLLAPDLRADPGDSSVLTVRLTTEDPHLSRSLLTALLDHYVARVAPRYRSAAAAGLAALEARVAELESAPAGVGREARLAAARDTLALADLRAAAAAPTVEVLERPGAEADWILPPPPAFALIAALVGALGWVLYVLADASARRPVHETWQLAAASGLPTLGAVPRGNRAAGALTLAAARILSAARAAGAESVLLLGTGHGKGFLAAAQAVGAALRAVEPRLQVTGFDGPPALDGAAAQVLHPLADDGMSPTVPGVLGQVPHCVVLVPAGACGEADLAAAVDGARACGGRPLGAVLLQP